MCSLENTATLKNILAPSEHVATYHKWTEERIEFAINGVNTISEDANIGK